MTQTITYTHLQTFWFGLSQFNAAHQPHTQITRLCISKKNAKLYADSNNVLLRFRLCADAIFVSRSSAIRWLDV